MSSMKNIFVALDNMNREEIFHFLDNSAGSISSVKMGLEIFNLYGREFVKEINSKYGVDIFLDLKLHDIPNTVSKAIKSLEGLPIKFLTIHLSGGLNMIKSSIESRNQYLPNCKILGVSILTSLDENDIESIWGVRDSKDLFLKLFSLANLAGADGVVCSPNELNILNELDHNLISMCPGIRFQDEIDQQTTGDQKRVLSPSNAFSNGATYLVMGRSLTKSKNLKERILELESIK